MLYRIYFNSVVFILFFTAGSKLFMAFGSSRILDTPSPLFHFLLYRQLLFIAMGIELTVALLILATRHRPYVPPVATASLALFFLSYRLVLWILGAPEHCDCFGNVSDALHLSTDEVNGVALIILAYFFAGGIYYLLVPQPFLSVKNH